MNIHTGARKNTNKRGHVATGKPVGRPRKFVEPVEVGTEDGLSKGQVFNVLRAVMPERSAKVLAGFKAGTNPTKLHDYDGTVAEIRERIQSDPQFGFLKQLRFYSEIRDNARKGTSDRIAAAKQLDVVAGYNAPAKVEVNERRTLVAAVKMLHQVRNETGLGPAELKAMLESRGRVVEAEGVLVESGVQNEP